MSMRFVLIAGLLLLPPAAWSSADSLHCGSRLVRAGDPIWQVARQCPEPFWRESYDRASGADRRGRPLAMQRVEIWTLNFGQRRFMRQLVFVDGRLSRIDSLGYGVDHRPGSRRCNPNELRNAGDTIAEVFARCGEPDYSYELPSPAHYGYHGGRTDTRERLSWTYDFGPRQHPRELLFVDGRLHRIRSERR
ncbi:DUF2845 domain-containing protein [Wenzhouxiangella sp. AB-CW3]|uniref:DUF2845 domain-containing protein n=1 Tax=Wenzhouxiangella sp. AB-CW3 TaxID=2771012 RepID=UPI00168B94AE|nr:DUF2845 domain-containing protein [Wenzhouxiangella sp. AB-CW3]QOC22094.1 DUF2845 domain-containing protein [Wenzhouxiangella sp. AB-CW3]